MPNNLGRQYSLHADEYKKKAAEVLDSGWYILGKEVEAFEKEWAEYIGAKYCVGLASGLDALWISHKLLGIHEGDDVIVCANAYIACVMGISMNGATPVFVEPDDYDNIDADKIDELKNLPFQGVCQLNHSMTELAGTVRGLNYQEAPYEQAKVIRCIKGSLYSIGVDLRKSSPTFGKWCGFELDAESGNLMYIPRGYAHGFVVYEDATELEYLTDNAYSKECAKSVRYDDPDIGIDWTHGGKIQILKDVLSDKNRNAKWLREIR